ncbi:MAG: ribosome maturation factor RimM [Candidatus Dormibacteria bacterium]
MQASASPVQSPRRLRAAFVRRAHGVRGELRVEPLGGEAGRFTVGLRLHVEDAGESYPVMAARPASDGDVLLRLAGVDDRVLAESLHGRYLCVDAADARGLGAQEWFVDQLVGLRAVTPEGAALGAVSEVEHYTAQDVLVVTGRNGERRFPFVEAFVTAVDVARGTITITPWDEDH